jgi:hypothetical protein
MGRIRDAVLWPVRQLRGAWANAYEVATTATLNDLLPPSIISTIAFFRDAIPRSLGYADSTMRHVTGIVVVSLTMILGSLTIATPVAIIFAAVSGTAALLRLLPAVEDRWPVTEDDWPLWTVGNSWVN